MTLKRLSADSIRNNSNAVTMWAASTFELVSETVSGEENMSERAPCGRTETRGFGRSRLGKFKHPNMTSEPVKPSLLVPPSTIDDR